ncbi:MAG: hypothetical protein ACSHXL_01005 [Bacteroidota bacterium]
MSWKSALRSIEAASKRIQREQERQKRRNEKQAEFDRKKLWKDAKAQVDRISVELHQLKIESLSGIGRSCGDEIDWHSQIEIPAPYPPNLEDKYEISAKRMLLGYKPTLMQKISRKGEKMREVLRRGIIAAQDQDRRQYELSLKEHNDQIKLWEEQKLLAKEVLKGNLAVYGEVMEEVGNFASLEEVGTNLSFRFSGAKKCRVEIDVKDIGIVPDKSLTLTSTGKLSTRKMPIGKAMEIYQDYVCGSLFRMARELQALFPIEFVVASAYCDLLNTATGLRERSCICTAGFAVKQFEEMNFRLVDFSDAMSLFRHEMKFSKRTGFSVVEALSLDDFDLSWIEESATEADRKA